ncbi:hypothetical protein Salat_2792500 [Sesamum alatum]|uniref:DUF4283 domain-containing protein n=1 Tax=Sesamum alatum TaxID=300844 RepID=A0AAE1XKZ7_9LAMI|nr:hypothetical protein Salat_2792500 [Sesamum alatum]
MARGKKTKVATEADVPSSQPHEQTHNVCASKQSEVAKASSQAIHAFISDLEASPAPIVVGKQHVESTLDKGNNADVEDAKPTSFAGLFSNNRKLTDENKLQKFVLGEGTLKLEMSDLIDVKAKLGFCLVGDIAGKFPGFKAIRTMAHPSNSMRVGGLSFALLAMKTGNGLLPEEDDISLNPVWAILPALPLECWNLKALGKIGSAVGNPIAMDSLTSKKERVSLCSHSC